MVQLVALYFGTNRKRHGPEVQIMYVGKESNYIHYSHKKMNFLIREKVDLNKSTSELYQSVLMRFDEETFKLKLNIKD